jgi:hypothetical protein
MANILKRNNTEESSGTGGNETSFIDKTMENWYCKMDENKIIFCKSVYDIISGNMESFVYKRMERSVRREKNGKEDIVERNRYILFTLDNNDKILVRVRGELK